MSEDVLVIKNGSLIDGTGAPLAENSSVVVKGGRVAEVAKSRELSISSGVAAVDATDKTIMPGLMDLHVHLFQVIGVPDPLERLVAPTSLSLIYAVKHAKAMLDAGFTTVRDLVYPFADYSGRDMVSLRTAIERGVVRGCRIFAAGAVTSTSGHLDLIRPPPLRDMVLLADGVDEVRKLTRRCIRENVDWIKTTSTGGMAGATVNQPGSRNYTLDELKAIVDEAHAAGLKVATHSEGIVGCRNAVEASVDTLEHATQLDDTLIEEILNKDISITLTMGVGRYRVEVLRESSQYLPKKLDGRPFEEVGLESHRKAMKAGVNIALGSDCGAFFPPGKNSYELDLYVRVLGMSPMDAILTATRNSAKALGRLNDLGTIEEGKIADMIVVEGNPLKDITILQNLNNIKVVIKEGAIEVDRRL